MLMMDEAEAHSRLTGACSLLAKELTRAADDLGSVDALCAILDKVIVAEPLCGLAHLDLGALLQPKRSSSATHAISASRSSSSRAGCKDAHADDASDDLCPGWRALELQLRVLQQADRARQLPLLGSVLWSSYDVLTTALLPSKRTASIMISACISSI